MASAREGASETTRAAGGESLVAWAASADADGEAGREAGTAAGLAGPRSALYTMIEASTAAATMASVKTMARIR
jgi:hypothetical protein